MKPKTDREKTIKVLLALQPTLHQQVKLASRQQGKFLNPFYNQIIEKGLAQLRLRK